MSTAIAADLGTPGAIESNAGDDFHILWACRRSLQLLNPDGGPTLVIVEGLSREDESGATDPDAFLGVDLTEYFGGESLSAAHRIVISQLKYSQRHPDRPWTAARLCESHSSTGTGKSKVSVITRLAQAFDGFYENHDRTAVVERLRIKLVSNRPADQGLVNALAAAQAWLEKNSGAEGIQARQLLAGTEQSHHDAIQRLQSASNLKSVAYCDFLRCLDLSDCNSDGRLWQRLRLIQELGTVAASPTERARDLYELVAAEALPKVGPRGLRREDILAALGCRGIGDLFPAPPSFETISDPIPTTDAAAMVRALHASPSRRLLAHGAGGVGKTIAVLAVPAFWLRGRCLLYDCFGQGTYLDVPGDERHSPRRALLQLCNQLAVLCGSPFLTQPPDSVDDLWRLFRERLAVAAKILEGSGESLLLVVDAADNAIRAAVTPEDSFVGYLWKVPLPDNTYLLMTARSGGRADSLGAPMDTPRIELAGFDPGASALHLRRVLATATDDEATQFHDLTHGNPRVQYHALSAAGDHPDIATVLHQARRKLDEVFQDYVAAALCLRFSSGDASSYLDDLVCFPRPLQLRNLSEILGLREPEVEALCGALHPGLRRTGDLWGFRDENFDTFLRERLSPEQTRAAHARLAQRMADLPDSDFAARHLAEQLFRAGSDRAVIDLALQDDAGIPIRDEVARVQVVRRRLALAVKAAARAERSETLVGLAIRAADAARSDAAILKLIGDYPDLAALHADPQTIAKHYLDAENQGWFGGAQLRSAALFSRDGQHHARAREHFQMAEAWLRRWMAAPKKERARWSISPSEIAAGAEALFRLTGPEAAARWLSGWRPLDAVLRACRWLADAIASDVPVAQQLSLYRSLRPHPLAAIMFLIAFHRRGATPPEALVEEVLLHAERYSRLNRHSFLQERYSPSSEDEGLRDILGIGFAELLASYGIDSERITLWLQRTCPIEPRFPPHDAHTIGRFTPQLRVLALLAELSGEEPTKEELERRLLKHHESTSDYERGEERRRFHDLIDPRLCLHRLRAEALLRRPRASDMVPRLMDRLRRGGEEPWRYGQGFDFFYRDAIPLVVDAALACRGDIEALLDSVTEEIERKFAEAPAYRWIDLAELLISRPEHTRRALLLLDQAANHLHEHPTDGEGHCGALLRAASLAQPRDSDQARDLFHRAVAVAREMNDDLSDRMGFLARAAQGLGSELDEAASRDLAAQLARLTEETRIYVSDGDRYLWESVLHAVLALHPPGGYALFARWSELGHLVIRADMHELALGGLELGALAPTQALALLRLSGDGYATSQAFLAILDATRQPNGSPSRELRDIVASTVRWVLRDLDRDERPSQARRLQKWLVQNGLGDWAEARALQEYLSFDAEYPRKDGGSDFEPIRSTDLPERSPFDWAHFFGSEPVAMRLTERFEALQQVPDGYALRGDFFSQARKRLLPSERATYLQALVELPDRRLYRDEYLDEWEHCLSDWRHMPSVQQWAEVGMLELARRHLPGVLGYQYQARESLERLLRLPFVQPAGWLDLLGPALSDWVERLESWQLYLIAEVLALGLSPPQRRDLLIEALGRGEQAIESRRGVPLPPPPSWALYGDDRRTPLATLLHILLGEPDTRIRWSCLHALREMRLQDDTELLAALMARLDVQDSGGFLPADTRFLWISARAYLLIFVARFAQDHPQALLPHAQTLLRHALSTDFPHAQIRELARRALLAVTEAIPGVLDDDALRRLDALHEPVSTETTAEHRMWGLADTRSHDGRFSFCSMDTLPYWYAPLGRRFGINADAVAAQAETWICDRWGIFGNQAWEVRRRRFSDRDWGLASNRHGSLPTIESYQLYLEYHAMHLVAGQLIDSRPLIKTRDDWESASWEYWLAPHLPTMQRHWLSELRDPVPLEPALHGRAQPPLPSWLEPELPAAFDRGLGLTPCGRADRLIVAARVGINARDRRETQQVESALVSPQTAHSLLRALQSIGDPHAYRLPPAGDDLEIDEPGFVLTGWIGDRSHENQLDGRDPLLHLMSTGHSSFPRAVQEALGVQTDAIGKRYLDIQRSEVAIAEISAWSDLTHDTEYAEYSEGWRLWISIDRLLEYLRDQQRCLIIEVQIDREQRREERRGFGFSQYKPPATLIYILHPDGHLESLVHHCCLGSADR